MPRKLRLDLPYYPVHPHLISVYAGCSWFMIVFSSGDLPPMIKIPSLGGYVLPSGVDYPITNWYRVFMVRQLCGPIHVPELLMGPLASSQLWVSLLINPHLCSASSLFCLLYLLRVCLEIISFKNHLQKNYYLGLCLHGTCPKIDYKIMFFLFIYFAQTVFSLFWKEQI